MTHPFTQTHWIWSADPGNSRFAVRRFRGTFQTGSAQTITLHVSADSRYLLYLDGKFLGRGPARSDLRHYIYDTYVVDVEPGQHVIGALVASYSRDVGPIAEMHDRGGLALAARDADGVGLCLSGQDGWRVQCDTAYYAAHGPISDPAFSGYAIGIGEDVSGGFLPWGWEQSGYEDTQWEIPINGTAPFLSGDFGDPWGDRWRLIPRDIPMMREVPQDFQTSASIPFEVPANSRHSVIVEAEVYATGYPRLTTLGGTGASVKIIYAEARSKNGLKGVRDDQLGTDVSGYYDTYRPGGNTETYIPLHWRAFRFVKLEIETADEPLIVQEFSYILTGYPWERQSHFAIENGPDAIATIQDIDFRTLERCTHETFMDCPYYEQLQYVGDTRLQALISYVTTGDTRLGKRAVRLFDWSRISEGLTQSRYPCNLEQIIPPFSLIWILMVEDLWRYAPNEDATILDCLSGCRSILEWFGKHMTSAGILPGHLPWWNFVDWTEGWEMGVPPPNAAGLPCATINLQYLAAIQAYCRLLQTFGEAFEFAHWQRKSAQLKSAIQDTFWDAEEQIMREGPDTSWTPTQHAQAWGILTNVIPEDAWNAVVDRLQSDPTLDKATYYHLFYIIEALARAGRLENLWEQWLEPYRDAMALHLQTWPERPEPTRSDCHAWSAWPTYVFLTHVLGVEPSSPGFASHTMTPKYVTGWDKVSGTVPTPNGLLTVSVGWTKGDGPQISSNLGVNL